MREEHQPLLRKISRISRILLPIVYLSLFILVYVVIYFSIITLSSPTAPTGSYYDSISSLRVVSDEIKAGLLTRGDKTILISAMMIWALILVPAYWFFIRMIHLFKNNELFTDKNVRYARLIAYLYSALVIIIFIAKFIDCWTPEGFTLDINITPGVSCLSYIMLGLVWIFVWMLEVGTALNLDSEMTI